MARSDSYPFGDEKSRVSKTNRSIFRLRRAHVYVQLHVDAQPQKRRNTNSLLEGVRITGKVSAVSRLQGLIGRWKETIFSLFTCERLRRSEGTSALYPVVLVSDRSVSKTSFLFQRKPASNSVDIYPSIQRFRLGFEPAIPASLWPDSWSSKHQTRRTRFNLADQTEGRYRLCGGMAFVSRYNRIRYSLHWRESCAVHLKKNLFFVEEHGFF